MKPRFREKPAPDSLRFGFVDRIVEKPGPPHQDHEAAA
jgi:hypothetical protein